LAALFRTDRSLHFALKTMPLRSALSLFLAFAAFASSDYGQTVATLSCARFVAIGF